MEWSLDHATSRQRHRRTSAHVPANPGYNLKVSVTPLAYDAVVPTARARQPRRLRLQRAHAGIKGKTLASIAKVVTKVGAYGTQAA